MRKTKKKWRVERRALSCLNNAKQKSIDVQAAEIRRLQARLEQSEADNASLRQEKVKLKVQRDLGVIYKICMRCNNHTQ
jgi:tetrahydromethanopterin S-methyltransferase subunit G